MTQGSRRIAIIIWGVGMSAALLAGCFRLPGARAAPVAITMDHLASQTITLGDIPLGFQIDLNLTPTNVELARQLAAPADAALLAQLGRQGGTYRLFTYALPEPTTLNGVTRATVEVDIFPSAGAAQAWLDARRPQIAGADLAAPAPGQAHVVHVTITRAGEVAATTTTLAYVEANAYVEIMTVFVGPGISIAEAARYADIIDGRLLRPPVV